MDGVLTSISFQQRENHYRTRQTLDPSERRVGGLTIVCKPGDRKMMSGKNVIRTGLLLMVSLLANAAHATTYYVDHTNGSDSNNGQSKSSPWQYAPGMYSAKGTAASTKLAPGDQVIFKGCVTWPNDSFNWYSNFAGNSGSPVYYGVDKTWWDNTVAGCGTSWNRPILDAQGVSFTSRNNDPRMIYVGNTGYVTFDNFEIRGYLADGSGQPVTSSMIDFGGGGNPGVIVENCYFHGWISPYFSIGTGNVAAGSNTITNYVPYSWSPAPAASWASAGRGTMQAQVFGYWPVQSNGPNANSITNTGGNSWTIVTNSSTLNQPCNGCVVQIGQDFMAITGGVEGACTGCMMLNNVIDGSDTAAVQLNPYGDCGASENNNNGCFASAVAGWRLPNIWKGNVIRYVASAFVGECSEWSGNLIEYIRLSTNPSAHTNGIECLDEAPVNGVTLSYNNVIRHTNNPNQNNPLGRSSIGLLNQYTPRSGSTEYIFNNVVYDTLQNAWAGFFTGGNGCCGSLVAFNNTSDCGPAWSLTYPCYNSYPNAYTPGIIRNNLAIGNGSVLIGNCSGNCSASNNLALTTSKASSSGYTSTTGYAYAPASSSGPSVAAGAANDSICATIAVANQAAGVACLADTTYGVGYDTVAHAAISPGRPPLSRSGSTDVGAYQYSGSTGTVTTQPATPPAPPTGLTATVD